MQQLLRSSPFHASAAQLAILLVIAVGCGQEGPRRYRVAGTVHYQGQPVGAGRVIFEPDSDQGNAGPAAYADIRDGRYATLDGLGTVGGPHIVRVICLSGEAEGAELAEGRMLCPEYHTTVNLPQANHDFPIEVPAAVQ